MDVKVPLILHPGSRATDHRSRAASRNELGSSQIYCVHQTSVYVENVRFYRLYLPLLSRQLIDGCKRLCIKLYSLVSRSTNA
jgi:hypothetical protein